MWCCAAARREREKLSKTKGGGEITKGEKGSNSCTRRIQSLLSIGGDGKRSTQPKDQMDDLLFWSKGGSQKRLNGKRVLFWKSKISADMN